MQVEYLNDECTKMRLIDRGWMWWSIRIASVERRGTMWYHIGTDIRAADMYDDMFYYLNEMQERGVRLRKEAERDACWHPPKPLPRARLLK